VIRPPSMRAWSAVRRRSLPRVTAPVGFARSGRTAMSHSHSY
jgi:hypothetical protein